MIKRISWTPGLLALSAAALLHAAPAVAERVDFCDITKNDCVTVYVTNQSTATITSVKIRQTTDNSCTEVTRESKANMDLVDKFQVAALDQCAYHFSFNTTKACLGTKDFKLTAEDIQNGYVWVALSGACGTLSTKKGLSYEEVGG